MMILGKSDSFRSLFNISHENEKATIEKLYVNFEVEVVWFLLFCFFNFLHNGKVMHFWPTKLINNFYLFQGLWTCRNLWSFKQNLYEFHNENVIGYSVDYTRYFNLVDSQMVSKTIGIFSVAGYNSFCNNSKWQN